MTSLCAKISNENLAKKLIGVPTYPQAANYKSVEERGAGFFYHFALMESTPRSFIKCVIYLRQRNKNVSILSQLKKSIWLIMGTYFTYPYPYGTYDGMKKNISV